MLPALRVTTTVLPGHRIEISSPELTPGGTVEIIVLPQNGDRPRRSALEVLQSIPPGPSPRAFKTWEEYERHLEAEP